MSFLLDKPLEDSELVELERFLLSDNVSNETLTLSTLDGFLTALVIGPTTVAPSQWLPRVWGSGADASPHFTSEKQANRIVGFLMRHMNGIVGEFESAPHEFEPLFDLFPYEGRDYLCGEGWAMGFMMGVDLVRADWEPIFENPAMLDVLRPLYLLGSEEVSDEDEALCETPLQREELTQKIVPSLVDIHSFWLPHRERVYADWQATTVRRDQPKVGANEPCPCGSGAKFKKCCGAVVTRH